MEQVRWVLKGAGATVVVTVAVFILVGAAARMYEASGLGEFVRSKWTHKAMRMDESFFADSSSKLSILSHDDDDGDYGEDDGDGEELQTAPTNAGQNQAKKRSVSLDGSAKAPISGLLSSFPRKQRSKSDLRLEVRSRTLSDQLRFAKKSPSSLSSSSSTLVKRISTTPKHQQRHQHQHAFASRTAKSTKEILADFQQSLEESIPFTTGKAALEYSSEEEEQEEGGVFPSPSPPPPPRLYKRVVVASLVLLTGLIVGGGDLVKRELGGGLEGGDYQARALAFVCVSIVAIGLVYRSLLARLERPLLTPSPSPSTPRPSFSLLPEASTSIAVDHVDAFASQLTQLGLQVFQGDPNGTELPSLRLVHSAIEMSAVFCILVTPGEFNRPAVYDELSWAIAKRPDSALVAIVFDDSLINTPIEYQVILTSISPHLTGPAAAQAIYDLVITEKSSTSTSFVWDVYLCHFRQAAKHPTPQLPEQANLQHIATPLDALALLVSRAMDINSTTLLLQLVAQQAVTGLLTQSEAMALTAVLKSRQQ
ncbi:hypothetical protein BASA81_005791 [Batrachochytrium salamandrivorans]|nr:hypothetical protein BASA81_005791 [Batrachochytrium salamandrivorans]